MSKNKEIEVVMNFSNAEKLQTHMSKTIAEIIINRIDKLPDEIKGYAYSEVIKKLKE